MRIERQFTFLDPGCFSSLAVLVRLRDDDILCYDGE
jgi:hypothetical protein